MHRHTQSPSHAGARGVADDEYRGGVRQQNGRLGRVPAPNWEAPAPALSHGAEPSRLLNKTSCRVERPIVIHPREGYLWDLDIAHNTFSTSSHSAHFNSTTHHLNINDVDSQPTLQASQNCRYLSIHGTVILNPR